MYILVPVGLWLVLDVGRKPTPSLSPNPWYCIVKDTVETFWSSAINMPEEQTRGNCPIYIYICLLFREITLGEIIQPVFLIQEKDKFLGLQKPTLHAYKKRKKFSPYNLNDC